MEVHHHLHPAPGVLPNLIEVKNLSTMTLDQIPISFKHDGEMFKGRFTKVSGAGDTGVWHLMDDKNFYNGRLRMVQDRWVFDPTPKTKDLIELTDYFGEVVTAWYE